MGRCRCGEARRAFKSSRGLKPLLSAGGPTPTGKDKQRQQGPCLLLACRNSPPRTQVLLPRTLPGHPSTGAPATRSPPLHPPGEQPLLSLERCCQVLQKTKPPQPRLMHRHWEMDISVGGGAVLGIAGCVAVAISCRGRNHSWLGTADLVLTTREEHRPLPDRKHPQTLSRSHRPRLALSSWEAGESLLPVDQLQ